MIIKPGEFISKRPLVIFSIFLIAGILASSRLSSNIPAFIFIVAIIGIFAIFLKKSNLILILLGSAVFFSVGFFEFASFKHDNVNRFIEYDGKEVEISGNIVAFPEVKTSTISYVIGVKSIKANNTVIDKEGKILLTVLKKDDLQLIDYGRAVSFNGELNLPKGQRNPGGFDYRNYLASNGISATVFANNSDIKVYTSLDSNFIEAGGLAVRNRIINVISRSLPSQQAGLLNGMLIGYREGLDKSVRDAFSDSGLMHLMAVSGSNVAFIILPLAFLFKKLRLRNRIANSLIMAILILFLYVTGFEPSVLRAVVMALVMLLGKIIIRDTDVYTSIAFAAIIMLIYNPMLIFGIGFQLSYAATLSLVLFYNNIKNKLAFKFMPDFIADVLAATLAAQVGVLPVSIYYFNQVSIISIISNVIVVPLTQFVTILGFIMAITGQVSILLSTLIGYVNCALLSFILLITDYTAAAPLAVLKVPTPSMFLIIIYYIGALFFLWYKPKYKPAIKFQYYIYTAALVLVVSIIPTILPRGLEVYFLDVGQGDSIFIRTSTGKTALIDGGGFSSRLNNETTMGEAVVMPFLLDFGVTRLDMVIATHGHDDHVQGLLPVINDFSVDKIILPDNKDIDNEFKNIIPDALKKSISISTLKRGDTIKLDKSTFLEVLHPKKDYISEGASLNNGSLVLKLDYKDTEILLTGDIEAEVEKLLIEDGVNIKSDVLKIAHHGSKTSSTEEFISKVNASVAVISVGNNSFGHPSPLVVNRMEESDIKLFRTDMDGAVVLKSNGKNIKIYKTVMVDK